MCQYFVEPPFAFQQFQHLDLGEYLPTVLLSAAQIQFNLLVTIGGLQSSGYSTDFHWGLSLDSE